MNRKEKRRKGKRKMTGWIIAAVIIASIGIGGAIGWSELSKEHNEIRNLPLDKVDFGALKDGVYTGTFDGGLHRWRMNTIRVTVESGAVVTIEVLEHKENRAKQFTDQLFNQVIEKRTLQVDVVSGATISSKAYLQGVENALIQSSQ